MRTQQELIAEVERLLCAHESAIRQHDRGAEWDEVPSATRAALLDAVRAIAAERDQFRDVTKLVQPADEVPMPDYSPLFAPRWPGDLGGYTASQLRTYGDAREAAAGKDAEGQHAFDCRTCAHFTADGCNSTVACIDARQYKATAQRQYWATLRGEGK